MLYLMQVSLYLKLCLLALTRRLLHSLSWESDGMLLHSEIGSQFELLWSHISDLVLFKCTVGYRSIQGSIAPWILDLTLVTYCSNTAYNRCTTRSLVAARRYTIKAGNKFSHLTGQVTIADIVSMLDLQACFVGSTVVAGLNNLKAINTLLDSTVTQTRRLTNYTTNAAVLTVSKLTGLLLVRSTLRAAGMLHYSCQCSRLGKRSPCYFAPPVSGSRNNNRETSLTGKK